MSGTIELRDMITRDMLKAEPSTLFVFGDNLARRGLGGQAREMRGEANAIGIPTKRKPSTEYGAYFDDGDVSAVKEAITTPFSRLADHIKGGGKVVWPSAGIGTGLADLERRAPAVWALLERYRERLFSLAPLSHEEAGR